MQARLLSLARVLRLRTTLANDVIQKCINREFNLVKRPL